MKNKYIIIYNCDDGKTAVSLMATNGNVWMNHNQLAELFVTSKQNISLHVINILKENELDQNSVVKDYLTTASKCTFGKYIVNNKKAQLRNQYK